MTGEIRVVDLKQEQLDALDRLRIPFPPASVEKLPKPFHKGAPKGKCTPRKDGGDAPNDQDFFCHKWHGLPAVHLDYIGHAVVTERLLAVDPFWNWEPMSVDEHGLPRFVTVDGFPVALWIKLTVCGFTRIGVGTVNVGTHDPEKQLISDAIRNAAMRFGVALDLWKKTREEDDEDAGAAPARGEVGQRAAPSLQPAGQPSHPQPPPDREKARMEQEVANAFGGPDLRRGGSQAKPLFNKTIRTIPITLQEDWSTIKATDLGGRGQWARHTWQALIDDEDGARYVEEYLLPKAEELFMKEPTKPLSWFYQKVMIAWEELDLRRNTDATFDPEKIEAEEEA